MDDITLTDLLKRPHWNRKVVTELLGEPDNLVLGPNGQVKRKGYDIARIQEAEQSGPFRVIVETDRREQELIAEQAINIRESLINAIRMDIESLSVPTEGALVDVFNYCRSQMYAYDNMCRIVDMDPYLSLISPEDVSPTLALYQHIAEMRPELAFEAGRCYERFKYEFPSQRD